MLKVLAKRFLAAVFVFALVLQTFSFAPVQAGIFKDINDEKLDQQLQVLNALGIIKGKTADTFAPNVAVKRSEMASIAVRMLKLGSSTVTGEQIFSDVNKKNSAFADIYTAHKLGIVVGKDEDRFMPKNDVSYAEAVKMIICVIGYEPRAQYLGGYPSGYLTVASELGILKGVSLDDNTVAATRGDIAKMVYNALYVDLMQKNNYGGKDDNKVEVVPGVSLLTKIFEYTKIEDVVTENENTSLNATHSAGKNEVVIGTTLIYSENSDIKKYLGYNVEAYYAEDQLGRNALMLFLPKNKSEITLDVENEVSATINGGGIKFEYTEEDKKDTQEAFSGTTQIIYNGKVYSGQVTQDVLDGIFGDFSCGRLVLVDNNADKTYDLINIEKYIPVVAKSINTLNKEITYSYCDGTDTTFTFNLDKYMGQKVDFSLYNPDGSELQLGALKEGNILSVYQSDDKQYYNIYVNTDTVTGEVTEIKEGRKAIIGEKEYRFASTLDTSLISLGLAATFSLDKNGNIADFKNAFSSGNIGMLYDVFIPEGGIDKYPQLRILTSTGEMQTIETEHEVYAYDGTKVSKQPLKNLICTDAVKKGYGNVSPYMLWYTDNSKNFTYNNDYSGQFYYRPWLTDKEKSDIASRKPIYFKQNSRGRITKILVPDIPDSSCVIKSLHVKNGTNYYRWTQRGGRPGNRIIFQPSTTQYLRINENAVCFMGVGINYDEKSYSVSKGSSCGDGAEYRATFYEVNDSGLVDIMLNYTSGVSDSGDSIVVDSSAIDTEGNVRIKGFIRGDEYEIVVPANTYLFEQCFGSISGTSAKLLTASTLKEAKTKAIYDMSVIKYPTLRTPSQIITENTLKRGDIVKINKNSAGEAAAVIMIMRADKGVGIVPNYRSVFSDRIFEYRMIAKGCITGFDRNQALVRIMGPFNGDLLTSPAYPENCTYSFFDETHLYHFDNPSTYIWEYDYETGKSQTINYMALNEGDIVMAFGSTYSPTQCIVLKNYPCEPDDPYTYWTED